MSVLYIQYKFRKGLRFAKRTSLKWKLPICWLPRTRTLLSDMTNYLTQPEQQQWQPEQQQQRNSIIRLPRRILRKCSRFALSWRASVRRLRSPKRAAERARERGGEQKLPALGSSFASHRWVSHRHSRSRLSSKRGAEERRTTARRNGIQKAAEETKESDPKQLAKN